MTVRKLILGSAALAAFAVALPAAAQEVSAEAGVQIAQREGRGGGWRSRDGGGDVDRSAARAERQAQRAERQAPSAASGDASQRPQARADWQQRRAERSAQAPQAAPPQRTAPDGGWRSQRAEGGQRYGRNWDSAGAVSRPAPAWRGATPATPDRGVTDQARSARWGERSAQGADARNWERNRSYGDATRNRTYRDGYRDGRRVESRDDRGEQRQAYRDGYRQGRTADGWRDRRDQTQAYRNGYASGSTRYSGDYRRWDRNDWRRDSRYNWYGYRSQHRDLYRAGRYYSPYRNWSYSRLSIGFFLQPLFYGNNYWINDPWQYRLPEAYGPYRWVRYYDDALLVDIYSGEVVDVIHDFFW